MNTPFTITASGEVQVAWSDVYAPITAQFTKMDGSRSINLESTYANQYSAGGDNALIDGLRGGSDFRTGSGRATRAKDLVAMVDLGEVKKLNRAGLSLLQDQKSWIFLPKKSPSPGAPISGNGPTAPFRRRWISRLKAASPTNCGRKCWEEGTVHQHRSQSSGPCPDWHVGKGGKTWIFADESLDRRRVILIR